jgi:hypothetical protein
MGVAAQLIVALAVVSIHAEVRGRLGSVDIRRARRRRAHSRTSSADLRVTAAAARWTVDRARFLRRVEAAVSLDTVERDPARR